MQAHGLAPSRAHGPRSSKRSPAQLMPIGCIISKVWWPPPSGFQASSSVFISSFSSFSSSFFYQEDTLLRPAFAVHYNNQSFVQHYIYNSHYLQETFQATLFALTVSVYACGDAGANSTSRYLRRIALNH